MKDMTLDVGFYKSIYNRSTIPESLIFNISVLRSETEITALNIFCKIQFTIAFGNW